MPKISTGRWEGAEAYRINLSREDDDVQTVDGQDINILRISIGGTDEIGYYLKFRGDPDDVLKVLKMMVAATEAQLPAGRYADNRTRRDAP